MAGWVALDISWEHCKRVLARVQSFQRQVVQQSSARQGPVSSIKITHIYSKACSVGEHISRQRFGASDSSRQRFGTPDSDSEPQTAPGSVSEPQTAPDSELELQTTFWTSRQRFGAADSSRRCFGGPDSSRQRFRGPDNVFGAPNKVSAFASHFAVAIGKSSGQRFGAPDSVSEPQAAPDSVSEPHTPPDSVSQPQTAFWSSKQSFSVCAHFPVAHGKTKLFSFGPKSPGPRFRVIHI